MRKLIAKKLDRLEEQVHTLIRQSNCPHKEVYFTRNPWNELVKQCKKCGKILKYYDTETELLEDKLSYVKEYSKQEIDAVKQEIKEADKQSWTAL